MKKAYFNTTQTDIEDVGPMYEIILPNGKQIEAFQDELTLIK